MQTDNLICKYGFTINILLNNSEKVLPYIAFITMPVESLNFIF